MRSKESDLSERITRMETAWADFREEFKEVKSTLRSIDEHIKRSIEFNETVKHSIAQQASIMNEVNRVREITEKNQNELGAMKEDTIKFKEGVLTFQQEIKVMIEGAKITWKSWVVVAGIVSSIFAGINWLFPIVITILKKSI